MELVWKYGTLIVFHPFLKSSIPFHSGIFHIQYLALVTGSHFACSLIELRVWMSLTAIQ